MRKLWIALLLVAVVLPSVSQAQLLRPFRSYSVPQRTFAEVCSGPGCVVVSNPQYATVAWPSIVTRTAVVSPVVTTSTFSLPTIPAPPPTVVIAPVSETDSDEYIVVSERFHRSVIRAARQAQQKGEITRLQLVRLRAAMLAPAFRERAEEVAVAQIEMSGVEDGAIHYDVEGRVIVNRIDWDALIAFLERLIPLLLLLLGG